MKLTLEELRRIIAACQKGYAAALLAGESVHAAQAVSDRALYDVLGDLHLTAWRPHLRKAAAMDTDNFGGATWRHPAD